MIDARLVGMLAAHLIASWTHVPSIAKSLRALCPAALEVLPVEDASKVPLPSEVASPKQQGRSLMALDAAEVYERLGSPEGELALAQAAVYLAMAPKSNAVYSAYNAVRELVRSDGTRPVRIATATMPSRYTMTTLGISETGAMSQATPVATATAPTAVA